MKKTLTIALSVLLLVLTLSFNIKKTNAEMGDTLITINNAEMLFYSDSYDRIAFVLYNKEGIVIENATGVRVGSPTATFTMGINGIDYTFNPSNGLSGYIASFGQLSSNNPTTSWPVYFKHSAGNDGTGNASYYPKDYPGLPKGQENVLTFYKGSVLGKYKFANEFSLIFSADGKKMDFVSNSHNVSYSESDLTIDGIYNIGNQVQATPDTKLTVTPIAKAGLKLTEIRILGSSGDTLTTDLTVNPDGTYTFTMPEDDISIKAIYEEITNKLNVNGEIINVKTGEKIGTLPKGFWNIDGYSISSDSLYMFDGDKEATLETYTLTLYVDGTVYDTITFDGRENVTLPPIPYKENAEIVGWSIDHLIRSDMTAYAIYK